MNPLDQQIQRLTALKQKRRHLLSEVKSGSKSSSSAAREHLETRLGDKSRRSLQDLWRKQKQQQVLRPHIQGLGMVRQDYLSKIRQLEEKRDDPWQKLQDKLATSFRIAPPQTRKQLFGVIKQNNTWTNPKTGKKQQHRFYSRTPTACS